MVLTPGTFDAQLNTSPGVDSVTSHTSPGIPGCLTRARLPTPKSPVSRRSTADTEAVHSGQRSTSLSVDQISSGLAAISIEIS